jgi:ABC-type Mn2+/Zn2+ transport system ATPase subunit
MLQKLYVNHYRCLENFEINLKDLSSVLLMGKNGAGKSTVASVLKVFQSIGRGVNRIGQLIEVKDFSYSKSNIPIHFEIETLLDNKVYKYILVLEFPKGFKEVRIKEEQLVVDGATIYTREEAKVTLYNPPRSSIGNSDLISRVRGSDFFVDWHLVALPIIQASEKDVIDIFRTWLARIVILSPIPSLMTGDFIGETLEPVSNGSNFTQWLFGLLSNYPASYTQTFNYLHEVMPDIQDFRNDKIGKDSKSLVVNFSQDKTQFSIDFEDLSDGEKCFFLCATVIAANKHYGPLFCFWDEPDNYLSISEVGLFIASLRQSFYNNGQILVTSHNSEAIRGFSDENTFFLDRRSHLEPTRVQLLENLDIKGDLINTLIRGDLES